MPGCAVPVDRTSPSGRAGRPHGLPAAATLLASKPDLERLAQIGEEVAEALVLFDQRAGSPTRWTYHWAPPAPEGIRSRRQTSGRIRSPRRRGPTGTSAVLRNLGALRYDGYRENRIRGAPLEHRSGDRPWPVCIHGFGMGSPAFDLRGFPCAPPAPRARAERRLPHPCRSTGDVAGAGRLASMPGVDMLDNVHGMTQAVWDVRQLVAHLRERSDGRSR